ncbi:MAG: hypothetical protein K6U74_08525 [Firmicutes bacterium]|nr:hypothetical protein [Bacillota bacterium]
MPVVPKRSPNRKEILTAAKELSEKITEKTVAAGLTHEDIKKDVYRAYLDVKRDRRPDRH